MKRNPMKYLLLLWALMLAAAGAAAQEIVLHEPASQAASAPAASSVPASQPAALYNYRQATLPNGMAVITVEDFTCPIVSVQMWYHVGSKDERADRTGFAHMFEHMMFRGTQRVKDIDQLISSIGGECNAYTTYDTTNFVDVAPANQLELLLWLEAERMMFLKVDPPNFATERKVVEEELLMYSHEPYGRLEDKIVGHLFGQHPYRWPVVGRVSHLRAATVAELRQFWETYYVPNNATLVICGAVSHDKAMDLARKHMAWLPKGKDVPRVTAVEPLPRAPRTVAIRNVMAPSPLVGLIYRTVKEGHRDRVALDMLGVVLGLGDSGRLQAGLVRGKEVALQAKAFQESVEQDGAFVAGVMLPQCGDANNPCPDGDPNSVLAELELQVARLRDEPVTPDELLKARSQMLKTMYEDAETATAKATTIAEAAILAGDASRVNTLAGEIETMTAQRLQEVARKYLDPNGVLRVIVQEDESGRFLKDDAETAAPVAAESNTPLPPRNTGDRPAELGDRPPVAAALPPPPQVPCTRSTLPNGLRVVVAPNHRTPLVTVYLGIAAGSWTEGESKPGMADFAMQMLTRSSLRGGTMEIAREQEKLGIHISSAADLDDSYVMATCTSPRLVRTVEMMSHMVLDPNIDAEEMDLFREAYIADVAAGEGTLEHVAHMELRRRIYGEHPYGHDVVGAEADIDAMKKHDVVQWWKKYLRLDLAVLVVAGDVDEKQAVELAQKAFGRWTAQGPRPKAELPPVAAVDKTRIYLIDRPQCSQSQIFVGCAGIARGDEGRFTAMLVSDYFGTNTCSRLFSHILSNKGLTYNIYGAYEPRRFGGEFSINTFSRTESTAEVLREILKEIDSLCSAPPGEDELARSRQYLLGSYATQHETPTAVAQDLWLIESQELGAGYAQKMFAAIAAADPKGCHDLVRRTIDPRKLVIVVAGNAAAIRKDLRKIAPVKMVQQDDTEE